MPRSSGRPNSSKSTLYYSLSDSALEHLAHQGDPLASDAIWKIDRVRQLATLPDPQIYEIIHCQLSDRLWLLFRREDPPRVGMYLEITDETTTDEIKDHWKEFRTWLVRLREWQGPDPLRGLDAFFLELHNRHSRDRHSYSRLAEILNMRVYGALREYYNDCCMIEEASKQTPFKTEADLTNWRLNAMTKLNYHNEGGYEKAAGILVTMGLDDDSIREICDGAISNFKNGQRPHWAEGRLLRTQKGKPLPRQHTKDPGPKSFRPRAYMEPITGEMVRGQLRHWRTKNSTFIKSKDKSRNEDP